VGQGDSLESPGQALAGAPRQAQGRGSGGNDVDRSKSSAAATLLDSLGHGGLTRDLDSANAVGRRD
jgi:hypothetical protein